MVAFPPCKINLGLHILSKRPDGYHELETCFYPVPWTDILEVVAATEFAFTSSGLKVTGSPEDNLCVKAYRLLQKDFSFGAAHIHLHKIIPFGAGLGGGSSDAAASLGLLNIVFNLSLDNEALQKYASVLGSDCAFFVKPRPMLAYGRGEVLEDTALDLQGKFLVLVKPDIHVSTAEAYARVTPKPQTMAVRHVILGDVSQWKNLLKNDFEESVFPMYPELQQIKNSLYESGALYASMSGSGSTVYGIFDQAIDLRKKFKGTTYWSGFL